MAMKFRAHETFFIRKGWLSKGMKYVQNRPDVFVSKKENPMDVLGIGSNMVKPLRYWLQTVGLTSEPHTGRRIQNFMELGPLFIPMTATLRNLGLCFCFSTSSPPIKRMQPLGIISSMNSTWLSSQKRISWQACRTMSS